MKERISKVYDQLLTKHKEQLKAMTKSIADISLSTIKGSLEDFHDEEKQE